MTGNPPGSLYPELQDDPRDEEERKRDRELVHRQVVTLRERQGDTASQQRTVELLARRRRDVPGAVQFEQVARGGATVLAATNLFLADGRDIDQRGRLLFDGVDGARLGDLVPVEGVARIGNVALFEGVAPVAALDDGVGRPDPAEVVAALRAVGVRISLNHITPLSPGSGIILKGDGGPGRSTSLPGRREVTEPLRRVVVAILDTGISQEKRSDDYLQNLHRPDNEDELDVFPDGGDRFLDAAAGHGTFVAGVVQQVAPAVDLRIYRVADSDGVTTEFDVAQQLLRAAAEGADIINLSLGTSTLDNEASLPMGEAVAQIGREHPHVLIVCAAGNGGDETPVWPAAFAGHTVPSSPHLDNVVSVAGLDPCGEKSSWSSHGDWVTLSTIGEGVVSTYVIGAEDPDLIGLPADVYGPDSWAVWTGTSFATPQISGALARICQEEDVEPPEALVRLRSRGEPVAGWGDKVILLHGT